jgi:hypothetical protein
MKGMVLEEFNASLVPSKPRKNYSKYNLAAAQRGITSNGVIWKAENGADNGRTISEAWALPGIPRPISIHRRTPNSSWRRI